MSTDSPDLLRDRYGAPRRERLNNRMSASCEQEIAGIAGIQEVHWITGEYNYLIKARVNSTDGLTDLMKAIGAIAGVHDSRTTLVLDTLKECQTLSTDYTETKQTARKLRKEP